MKRFSLKRFEKNAQKLVEGSLGRLFGGRIDSIAIMAELTRILEEDQLNGRSPNGFILQFHPSDYGYLRLKSPVIAVELCQEIEEICMQSSFLLSGKPSIDIVSHPTVQRGGFLISAEHVVKTSETTRLYETETLTPTLANAVVNANAFLIVDGGKHVPLTHAQTTIGRLSTNHIVLSDPTVSRFHAQIQFRFGRFALYDLDSRIGTFVNGEAIQEFLLRSGDVIQLGKHSIIFHQSTPIDDSTEDSMGQTQSIPSVDNS